VDIFGEVGLSVGADPCKVLTLTLKSKQTKAKVLLHLVTWVRVGRGIPHGKVIVSLSAVSYSKSKKDFKQGIFVVQGCTVRTK
jgi:hypothetical protein